MYVHFPSGQGNLARRARTRTALFLVSLPSQGGFEFCFLARRHEERVLLCVLDYLFGHDFPLEPPQSALNRFTRVNIHYCHLFLQSSLSQLFQVARFRTHIKHAPQSQGQARMENPANSSRYPRGSPSPMQNKLGRNDLKFLLSTQALDLDGFVAVIRLNLLLLEYHFLIKLTHHDFLFVRSLRSFHLWFMWSGQIYLVESKVMCLVG